MNNYIFDPQLQCYLSDTIKGVPYIDGKVLRKYYWLNCHCLREYIELTFIFEKSEFVSGTSPEGDLPRGLRTLWMELGSPQHLILYYFLFFFKKNVIFLLIPLPSASFNGIKRQINLSKSLGWLQGYMFALSGSPWKLQAGCALSVQTLSEVGNPHVWRADSLCGGKSTSSSITNTCLVNKGQVKRPWDYMDYGTWLHRLTRQLKAAGTINILPRGAAIGL